ncbi:Crp/Fnr family transcriptional regulator [Nitratireductor sp. ZSWI3]|uniref:Crp/Fnr family transcriptional regulator n=1 Tax=Nitratireductor sp. ZSWI3 TaxID=2966359 RepID=UPI00214FE5BA|nr:helix-turn-helix domain-containing protein [Nitratireductor sp. ZSWI3]MCR4264612.1 helix-turn-helix domain-containing protein [Nitratireductor sp. ZSWI3]
MERLSHIRTFKAGATILAEGEDMPIVGNVVSGVLRVQKTISDGRQQIVGLLLPPDMFGRVFAPLSPFAIEAATDVTLCCFPRPAFEKLLTAHRELEHRMLLTVLEELDAAREWMLMLGCQTVAERVASFLLILHRRFKDSCREADIGWARMYVEIPISRRDMAAYLGTTVETISRTIQTMARKNVIRMLDTRHFEIVDEKRMVKMSGREELAISADPLPSAMYGAH